MNLNFTTRDHNNPGVGVVDRTIFGDLDTTQILAVVQESSYDLLAVLVPNLDKRIPEYEFRGFGSREAMGARRYNEPPHRHLMGRILTLLVKIFALRGFEDTQ